MGKAINRCFFWLAILSSETISKTPIDLRSIKGRALKDGPVSRCKHTRKRPTATRRCCCTPPRTSPCTSAMPTCSTRWAALRRPGSTMQQPLSSARGRTHVRYMASAAQQRLSLPKRYSMRTLKPKFALPVGDNPGRSLQEGWFKQV